MDLPSRMPADLHCSCCDGVERYLASGMSCRCHGPMGRLLEVASHAAPEPCRSNTRAQGLLSFAAPYRRTCENSGREWLVAPKSAAATARYRFGRGASRVANFHDVGHGGWTLPLLCVICEHPVRRTPCAPFRLSKLMTRAARATATGPRSSDGHRPSPREATRVHFMFSFCFGDVRRIFAKWSFRYHLQCFGTTS